MYPVISYSFLPMKNKAYFQQIFETLQISKSQVKVASNVVVPLFKASQLPFNTWKDIWKLACSDSEQIYLLELIQCLKFIQLAQNQ